MKLEKIWSGRPKRPTTAFHVRSDLPTKAECVRFSCILMIVRHMPTRAGKPQILEICGFFTRFIKDNFSIIL